MRTKLWESNNDEDDDESSMKIAVRQMVLGRQAACMCVSVDSSHETVHIMSTSIPVQLIGYMDLFFLT